MTDNFEQISNLLEFDSDDIYYHLQIIRRGKDHPELASANRTIKSYYICKKESLEKLEQEIKDLCHYFGARAYINLAPKSIKKTTLLQLKYISERVYNGDYKKIWKSWDSCTGEVKGEKAAWVVDLDDKPIEDIPNIAITINEKCNPEGPKCWATIKTKSGYHLITKAFDLKQFKEYYPDIDVHKNNPTLLYENI